MVGLPGGGGGSAADRENTPSAGTNADCDIALLAGSGQIGHDMN